MTTATCAQCGATLSPDDRFCGDCGSPLEAAGITEQAHPGADHAAASPGMSPAALIFLRCLFVYFSGGLGNTIGMLPFLFTESQFGGPLLICAGVGAIGVSYACHVLVRQTGFHLFSSDAQWAAYTLAYTVFSLAVMGGIFS